MTFQEQIQQKIDLKTKPYKALGQLEQLAFQIANIQQSLTPELKKPHLFVFAGDHGLAKEGVSAYPQEVTYQMVLNFLNGGAAINVFCKQHAIELKVIDAGVIGDFEPHDNLVIHKAGNGSANMLHQKAMTEEQLDFCLKAGASVVEEVFQNGCNIVGFGEMGIGNTSSSSLILSSLFNLPIEELTGRGTGVDDTQLQNKINILKKVQNLHQPSIQHPKDVLQSYGGFEVAQMVGAMEQAFKKNMIVLIDGFIATAAFSIIYHQDKSVINNAIFCHQSDEQAHGKVLSLLGVNALLNLNLRVGEGTGCALAYPLIQSAVHFLNEMASFESANVSNK